MTHLLERLNYKSKPQKDTTLNLLEWLLSTKQVVTSVGKVMGEKEPSYAAGRTTNWYNHCGEQYGGSSVN